MTKKDRELREKKLDRWEKVILRLRHIPYSDEHNSSFQRHMREYNKLREELILGK